jgi:hypothetical protein
MSEILFVKIAGLIWLSCVDGKMDGGKVVHLQRLSDNKCLVFL